MGSVEQVIHIVQNQEHLLRVCLLLYTGAQPSESGPNIFKVLRNMTLFFPTINGLLQWSQMLVTYTA